MKVKVLCFGITRDLLGSFEKEIELVENASIKDLKTTLYASYPDLLKLNSLRIAVNEEYSEDEHLINEKDEVVLIPPVSGG